MSCTTCGKSVFGSAKAIATGAINLVFETKEIEVLAAPRLAKCKVCPHMKVLITLAGIDTIQCTLCKCLCSLKARVETEQCPLQLW